MNLVDCKLNNLHRRKVFGVILFIELLVGCSQSNERGEKGNAVSNAMNAEIADVRTKAQVQDSNSVFPDMFPKTVAEKAVLAFQETTKKLALGVDGREEFANILTNLSYEILSMPGSSNASEQEKGKCMIVREKKENLGGTSAFKIPENYTLSEGGKLAYSDSNDQSPLDCAKIAMSPESTSENIIVGFFSLSY